MPAVRRTTLLSLALVAAAAAPVGASVLPEPQHQLSTSGTTLVLPAPSVGAASDGYAVAAWVDTVEGQLHLVAATRSSGGTWSSPTQVSTLVDGGGLPSPARFDLDVNPDGDAALAWLQDNEVRVAQLPRGSSGWAGRQASAGVHRVFTFETPQVTVVPDGTAVVAWLADTDPDASQSSMRVLAGSGTPTDWVEEQVVSGVGGDASGVSLSSDGTGRAQVLWLEETDVLVSPGGVATRDWVVAVSRDDSGAWSTRTPFTSVQDPYAAPSGPVTAGDRTGTGFAHAWTLQPTTEEIGLGITGPALRLSRDGTVRSFRAASFTYALRGLSTAGGHTAAMLSWNDGSLRLGVTTLRGGQWSDVESPLGSDAPSSTGETDLVVHPDGAASVAFLSGTTRRVRGVQRAPGSTVWDESRAISSISATSSARVPALAVAGGRTVVALWSAAQDVWAGGFTSDTPAAGPPSPAPVPPPPAPGPAPVPTPTPPVTTPPPSTFGQVTAPRVKGKARVGRTLRAIPGSWTPAPTRTTYRWLADGKQIRKATRARLTVTPRLRGTRLQVRITLTASGVEPRTVRVAVPRRVR